jgi:hypothetical protein
MRYGQRSFSVKWQRGGQSSFGVCRRYEAVGVRVFALGRLRIAQTWPVVLDVAELLQALAAPNALMAPAARMAA